MNFSKVSLGLVLFLFLSGAAFAQSALKRADKQYELSAFKAAAASYLEVLNRDRDNMLANARLADSFRHLNELEKALPYYQKAVSLNDVPDLYVFQYGLTLQGLGRYDIAQQVFEQLAVSSPEFRTRALQFAEACKFANSQSEPALFTVRSEYLNTASADFAPALFKDERLVYASGRSDIQGRNDRNAPPSNPAGASRLLITQRDRNGYLETPTTLHSGFNTATNEGPIAYTQDGSLVAITKNNFSDGVRQIPSSGLHLNLFLANADANGDWVNTKPFPYNGPGFSNGYPSFSNDGKALFFASDRPGGFGGFDIYVCYRVGDSWSQPENLGQPVNSQGNEISPFFDGSALYFASDFHRGFGGFDIFRAEESGSRWATIFHGGDGLNSSSDDYGFVFDPLRNIGYFTSNRPGGKGAEDIYKVEKQTDNVVIKVTDAASGLPIGQAEIDFTDCGDESYLTDANGVFNFQLLDDLNCTARIKKEGYLPTPFKITSMGLRQNRNVTIPLTSTQNAYQGKTVNSSTGSYLDDVKIIATPQGGAGTVVSAFSDEQGGYFVALQPNQTYLLRFSKAGFQDVTLTFRSATNDSRIIRNVDLLPVGAKVPVGATATTRADDAAASNTVGTVSKSIPAGFSVQLAAIASNAKVDLSSYEAKLKGIGSVYSVLEDGKTKIRLGVFESRSAALDAQQKCRKKGYTGAFTVSESAPQTINSAASPAASTTPAKATPAAPALNGYMVRLATYGNLDYFNRGTVDDVGVVTFLPKGSMTIVLLSGYDSLASAQIGLRKAKVRGFPDAYLVEAKNGELEKVN